MIEEFLDHFKKIGRAPFTITSYRVDLEQFRAHLAVYGGAENFPEDITRRHVEHYLRHLEKQGYSPTSITRKLASLRSFYRHLARLRKVQANPTAGLRAPRPQCPPAIHVPRDGVIANLLDAVACKEPSSTQALRDRAILHLMAFTGLRLGELSALDRADISLTERTLTVTRRTTGLRIVPLTGNVLESLWNYYLYRVHTGTIGSPAFLNKLGSRLTGRSMARILESAASCANLTGITPDGLRHAFAKRLQRNGASMKKINYMLGHATMATTEKFIRTGG